MADPDKMTAAVHAYIAAFEAGSADQVIALFAADATVEDPVGSPPVRGLDAIREFYESSMKTGAKLTLEGPIRVVGDYAAFPFAVRLHWQGSDKRVDVIDIFRFDEAGKIIEMRAFFGPANMHGFN